MFGYKSSYCCLAPSQAIYCNFLTITAAVQNALAADAAFLIGKVDNYYMSTLRQHSTVKFRTIGLLVTILEYIAATNSEGVFADFADDSFPKAYDLASMDEAVVRLKKVNGVNPRTLPVIFVDEVPKKENDDKFNSNFLRCLLLRNFIRCLPLVCFLSGTELSLMNQVDNAIAHSTCERGINVKPFVKIIGTCPLNLEVLLTKNCYVKCSKDAYLMQMLSSTRPRFVQYFQECCPDGRICLDTLVQLSEKMREGRARHLGSNDGIMAQVQLVFAESLSHCPNSSVYMRSHFGDLHISVDVRNVDGISPGILYTNGNQCLYGDKECKIRVQLHSKFKLPNEDPFLFLICLRNGFIIYKDDVLSRISSSHAIKFAKNPSTSNFAEVGKVKSGNSNSTVNTGKDLEEEVHAAIVVASHCSVDINGTSAKRWFELVLSELSINENFEEITLGNDFPIAIANKFIGLISPPNTTWLVDAATSSGPFHFANFTWSKNKDERDGYIEVIGKFIAVNGIRQMFVECKDDYGGFGGKKLIPIIKKFIKTTAEMGILVCCNLSDSNTETVALVKSCILENPSAIVIYKIYRARETKNIVCELYAAEITLTNRYFFMVDLESIYPGRMRAVAPYHRS